MPMSTEALLQETQDRQAIVDLTIAYAWIIDHGDRHRLSEIFTSDAVFTLRDIQGGGSERQMAGIDDIVAKIDGSLGRLSISQHLISNQQVQIEGDTATCGCYLQAQHTQRGTPGGDNYIMAGRYEDELSRTTDGWRITQRTLTIDWVDGNLEVRSR